MSELTYSAGLVSQTFWFLEFKKTMTLLFEGKTSAEIKTLCLSGNIYGTAKKYRAKEIFNCMMRRVKMFDDEMIQYFNGADLESQKLVNLIAILKYDRLFFEFLYEVYREKILMGDYQIEDTDVMIFFHKKGLQNEKVESMSESTQKKLKDKYFNFMKEAGLLHIEGKVKKITPPIPDPTLYRYLANRDDLAIIKAITGVN